MLFLFKNINNSICNVARKCQNLCFEISFIIKKSKNDKKTYLLDTNIKFTITNISTINHKSFFALAFLLYALSGISKPKHLFSHLFIKSYCSFMPRYFTKLSSVNYFIKSTGNSESLC